MPISFPPPPAENLVGQNGTPPASSPPQLDSQPTTNPSAQSSTPTPQPPQPDPQPTQTDERDTLADHASHPVLPGASDNPGDTGPTAAAPQADAKATTETQPKPKGDGLPTTPGPVEAKGDGRFIVRVYPNKCIAAASCIAIAPNTFKLNQQDTVEILETVVNEKDAQLLLAAQSCPTMAIEIIDMQTGETIWPN